MNIVKRLVGSFDYGRGNNKVTGIVIHTEGLPPRNAQGQDTRIYSNDDRTLYYWFNNINNRVSSHYYVTFSGKIEQYVEEGNTAWHAYGDGNQNVQTIGIEFQDNGFWEDGTRYTDAQYEAGAQLVADICKRHGIPCAHGISGIRPHCEIDNKPCPGALNWRKIINRANEILNINIEDPNMIAELQKQVSNLTTQIGVLEQDKIELQDISKELKDKNDVLEKQVTDNNTLIASLQKEVQAYMQKLGNYTDYENSIVYKIYLLLSKNAKDKGTTSQV